MKFFKGGIIELDSGISGNTTTIMVGVHGNELSGVYAINDIVENIEITSGKVYFIFANLKALEIGERLYEKNMNRCFLENNKSETYEDKRVVNDIIPYLLKSNYLLDVHNTLNENNSIPFLISEHSDLGKYFDVDLVVSGFDNLHPGGSDGFMNNLGKVGLCLESGSIYDEKGYDIAKNGILNFLKYTKNISGTPKIKEKQEFINFDDIYKNKSLDFKFAKRFNDFEKIEKGQLIAIDGGKKIYSDRNGYIVFTYIPQNLGEECFCLGK